jgi:hypothetical protein
MNENQGIALPQPLKGDIVIYVREIVDSYLFF